MLHDSPRHMGDGEDHFNDYYYYVRQPGLRISSHKEIWSVLLTWKPRRMPRM